MAARFFGICDVLVVAVEVVVCSWVEESASPELLYMLSMTTKAKSQIPGSAVSLKAMSTLHDHDPFERVRYLPGTLLSRARDSESGKLLI